MSTEYESSTERAVVRITETFLRPLGYLEFLAYIPSVSRELNISI